jgi:hypothetical protein
MVFDYFFGPPLLSSFVSSLVSLLCLSWSLLYRYFWHSFRFFRLFRGLFASSFASYSASSSTSFSVSSSASFFCISLMYLDCTGLPHIPLMKILTL